MSNLKLFLLGTPQLEIDNTPIELERRKAMASGTELVAVPGREMTRSQWSALRKALVFGDQDASLETHLLAYLVDRRVGRDGHGVRIQHVGQGQLVEVFSGLAAPGQVFEAHQAAQVRGVFDRDVMERVPRHDRLGQAGYLIGTLREEVGAHTV